MQASLHHLLDRVAENHFAMQGKFEIERHHLGNDNNITLLIINNCDHSYRDNNNNNNNENKSDHSLAMSLVS